MIRSINELSPSLDSQVYAGEHRVVAIKRGGFLERL